jgi:hypothetical protein
MSPSLDEQRRRGRPPAWTRDVEPVRRRVRPRRNNEFQPKVTYHCRPCKTRMGLIHSLSGQPPGPPPACTRNDEVSRGSESIPSWPCEMNDPACIQPLGNPEDGLPPIRSGSPCVTVVAGGDSHASTCACKGNPDRAGFTRRTNPATGIRTLRLARQSIRRGT